MVLNQPDHIMQYNITVVVLQIVGFAIVGSYPVE